MAKRFWIARWSMGYVGTETEEHIDLHDWYSPEDVAKMTDSEACEEVAAFAWEEAKQMIDAGAAPDDEKN